MATKHDSSSEALKKLEDQLKCPKCLDNFINPKTLPCLHSFCQHCLQDVPTELGRSKCLLTCPSCRSSCDLPEAGVSGLPTAFFINNLSEVHRLLKKVSIAGDVSCDNCSKNNAIRYCKQCALFYCQECLCLHNKLKYVTQHDMLSLDEVANTAYELPHIKSEETVKCSSHNKPLDIYCETCEELVCQHCTVRIHRDHEYDVVSDTYSKHRQCLEGCLHPVKAHIEKITEALAELMQRRNKIMQQGDEVKENIRMSIQHITEQLQKTGRKFSQEVESAVEVKVDALNDQMKRAEAALEKLKECSNYVEQGLKICTPQQVLSSKAQMENRSRSVVSGVEKERFEPVEQADIKLDKGKETDVSTNIGKISYSSVSRSKVHVLEKSLPFVEKGSSCTISFSSSNGSPVPIPSSLISCYFTSPDNERSIECTIKESSLSEKHKLTFVPFGLGDHYLHVRVGGISISDEMGIPVSIAPLRLEKEPKHSNTKEEYKTDALPRIQVPLPATETPTYQVPSVIERQQAPTGNMYALPQKKPQHPKVETPTYQVPSVIEIQQAPTGDLYALPQKKPQHPKVEIPTYVPTVIERQPPTGDMYPMPQKKPQHSKVEIPTYQVPSVFERQQAPTGDMYALPQKKSQYPKVEIPTYQVPSVFERQQAPTGDLYALPQRKPQYSKVEKSKKGSPAMYAELGFEDGSQPPISPSGQPLIPQDKVRVMYADVRGQLGFEDGNQLRTKSATKRTKSDVR